MTMMTYRDREQSALELIFQITSIFTKTEPHVWTL